MNILTAEHLKKSYTERLLFDDASFYLHEGEKVGILGINGTGKSTLLKILAGMEEPEEGKVVLANHVVLRYLPQHPVFEEGKTVLEAVLDVHKGDDTLYNLEADAKTMMTKLGITDFTQPVEQLSGGQKSVWRWLPHWWHRQTSSFWTSLQTIWTMPWQTGWKNF